MTLVLLTKFALRVNSTINSRSCKALWRNFHIYWANEALSKGRFGKKVDFKAINYEDGIKK